jgi:hypothetical protein
VVDGGGEELSAGEVPRREAAEGILVLDPFVSLHI